MENEYNQKEENTFRKELFRRMGNQDTLLAEIKAQTLKTNGRVNKLENWRALILGTMSAASIIFGLITYIWVTQIGDIKTSERQVAQELQEHLNGSN